MKRIICAFLAALFAALLCSCGSGVPGNAIFSANDLAGKRVGVLAGAAAGSYARLDETTQVLEFAEEKELRAALKSGVVDCAVIDGDRAEPFANRSGRLTVLEMPLVDASYSIITARENADLQEDINSALAVLTENETLQKIIDRYIRGTDYEFEPQGEPYEVSGTVTLAVSPDFPPYSYYDEQGQLTGLDIDVARAICDVIGLKLEFIEADHEEILPLVQQGIATMGMGRFAVNQEELELVDFSDPYYTSVQDIVVRKR